MSVEGNPPPATDQATEDDHRLAGELASRAGVLLVELRQRYRLSSEPLSAEDQTIADSLRAEGDRLAHEFLAAELAEARPADALLSEEAPDDRRRLSTERVWIIDPLDGTNQYGESGRIDWAVHVALVIGGVPAAGAIALPAEAVTYSTSDMTNPLKGIRSPSRPYATAICASPSSGAGLKGIRAPSRTYEAGEYSDSNYSDSGTMPPAAPAKQASPTDPTALALADGGDRPRLRLVASRSRPNPHAAAIAAALGAELNSLGSVGAKVAEVIRGRADAYIHSGGHHEWDSAAPVAVARALGLHTSRLDGGPLRYNQADPIVADLLVCRPEIVEEVVAAYANYASCELSRAATVEPLLKPGS